MMIAFLVYVQEMMPYLNIASVLCVLCGRRSKYPSVDEGFIHLAIFTRELNPYS
tara:strand:+ start:220 stop:381 length:162 start_codon:yes stop_codon:yes gene_type:complete